MRTQPGQDLDCSLIRAWAEDPAKKRPTSDPQNPRDKTVCAALSHKSWGKLLSNNRKWTQPTKGLPTCLVMGLLTPLPVTACLLDILLHPCAPIRETKEGSRSESEVWVRLTPVLASHGARAGLSVSSSLFRFAFFHYCNRTKREKFSFQEKEILSLLWVWKHQTLDASNSVLGQSPQTRHPAVLCEQGGVWLSS